MLTNHIQSAITTAVDSSTSGFSNFYKSEGFFHLIVTETEAAVDRAALVYDYRTSYHALLFPCGFFVCQWKM